MSGFLTKRFLGVSAKCMMMSSNDVLGVLESMFELVLQTPVASVEVREILSVRLAACILQAL